VPALHSDLLNDEPQQLLPLREVECINHCGDAMCKVADAAQASVVPSKLVPLPGECLTALGEITLAMIDLAATSVQLGQVDNADLVEVHQASPFRGSNVQLALKPCEFSGKEFIVGRWGIQGQGLLTRQQHIGAEEAVAHLLEHEAVECIRSDIALRTPLCFAASA
jgi:hypothetical protein